MRYFIIQPAHGKIWSNQGLIDFLTGTTGKVCGISIDVHRFQLFPIHLAHASRVNNLPEHQERGFRTESPWRNHARDPLVDVGDRRGPGPAAIGNCDHLDAAWIAKCQCSAFTLLPGNTGREKHAFLPKTKPWAGPRHTVPRRCSCLGFWREPRPWGD